MDTDHAEVTHDLHPLVGHGVVVASGTADDAFRAGLFERWPASVP
jgi:hypothetical protein